MSKEFPTFGAHGDALPVSRFDRAQRTADLVLMALAIISVGAWFITVVTGVRRIETHDFVEGEWVGLATYAADGKLYPPIYEDGHYGGARSGPIPILLHGALFRITGDPIVSGRTLSAVGTALLMVAMAVVLRRSGCRIPLMLAISTGGLLSTQIWFYSLTTRFDAWSAAAQLAAISFLVSPTAIKRRAVVAAGIMCGFAFFIKVTAISAPLGLALWLLMRHRDRLLWFLISGTTTGVILFLAVQFVSAGRFLENLNCCLFSNGSATSHIGLQSVLASCQRIVAEIHQEFELVWITVPAVAFASIRSPRRGATPVGMCFLVCLPITAYVMTDGGTGTNHLIDLAAFGLTAICLDYTAFDHELRESVLGHARLDKPLLLSTYLYTLLALSLSFWCFTIWMVQGRTNQIREGVRDFLRNDGSTMTAKSWLPMLQPSDSILSADAAVPVLLGQRRPVILNSHPLRLVVERNPQWGELLARRIKRHEFDWVVTETRIDIEAGDNNTWGRGNWGKVIIDALDKNYQYDRPLAPSMYLYRPRTEHVLVPASGSRP